MYVHQRLRVRTKHVHFYAIQNACPISSSLILFSICFLNRYQPALPRPLPPTTTKKYSNLKLLYCRQWHPYTMHLRHVMGFVLFTFPFRCKTCARCMSVYFRFFFSSALAIALALVLCAKPQIFPCTRAPCPRNKFQVNISSSSLHRIIYLEVSDKIPTTTFATSVSL